MLNNSPKKSVIALCGSTRAVSTNLSYIKAVNHLAQDKFKITIFNGLEDIPHFNPDYDNDNPPKKVIAFRNTLRAYDGILICTPEYAMGVPGTLKNAIDWTVSSMEFSKKPVALITASSLGEKGHASLLETLKILEAEITEFTQLLISHAKTKITTDHHITNEKTLTEINRLIEALSDLLYRQPHNQSSVNF